MPKGYEDVEDILQQGLREEFAELVSPFLQETPGSPLTRENLQHTRDMMRQEVFDNAFTTIWHTGTAATNDMPQSGTSLAILQDAEISRMRVLMRRFNQVQGIQTDIKMVQDDIYGGVTMPELIPWTEEQERMLRASDAGEVIASVNDGHVYNKPEFHILEMLATEYPSVRIVAKMEGLTAFPLRLGHTFLLLQNYVMLAENKLYCKTDDAIVIFKLVKFASWEGKRFGLILECVDIQMDNEVRGTWDIGQIVEEQ